VTTEGAFRILSDNRKARHDYHLLERYEAGLALTGTEVKAAREGKVQLREGYAEIAGSEAWLVNVHISHYVSGNIHNHEVDRRRKLLLHRREIDKLLRKTREKGLTLIPTKVYLKQGRIKCEIAVARGKREHDKRDAIRTREREREARAAIQRQNAR
jgi:SsrA-binding protein